MDSKKWYASKTLWIGFLVFLASILKLTGVVDLPVDSSAAWLGTALGIIQVVLRAITKEEISF